MFEVRRETPNGCLALESFDAVKSKRNHSTKTNAPFHFFSKGYTADASTHSYTPGLPTDFYPSARFWAGRLNPLPFVLVEPCQQYEYRCWLLIFLVTNHVLRWAFVHQRVRHPSPRRRTKTCHQLEVLDSQGTVSQNTIVIIPELAVVRACEQGWSLREQEQEIGSTSSVTDQVYTFV